MKKILLFAGLLVAAAGQASAREAGTAQDIARVPYELSELTTDEGIRALRERVREAVDSLCTQPSDHLEFNRWLACAAPAQRDAFAQLRRAIANHRAGTFADLASVTVRAR